MKIKTILTAAVVCLMAASCAEKPVHDLDPNMMNGKYEGINTTSVSGAIMLPTEASSIEIKVLDEEHLTVSTLYSEQELKFENCTVTRIKGGFAFAGEGFEKVFNVPGMSSGSPAKPTNHVFSDINGTFVNGKVDFTYSYKPGQMPMKVTTTFAQADEAVLALEGTRNVKGTMKVNEPMEPVNVEVLVTVHSNELISFSFPAMGSGHMSIPEFDLTGEELKKIEGVYAFTGKDFEKTFKDKSNPDDKGMKISFSGLEGKFVNGKLQVSYKAKPGAMPMLINFTYAE